MKALIAFICMALVILALIEINERIKAKKTPPSVPPCRGEERGGEEDCLKENPEQEDCSGCGLIEVCEKSSGSTPK